jgi:hypothetical protein
MRTVGLVLCSLLLGCGSPQSASGSSEQDANRAALVELRARGQAERAAAALDESASGSGAVAVGEVPVLPTLVLAPDRGPSALTDAGALRRSGITTFCAGGPHMVLGAVEMLPASVDGRVVGFAMQSIHTERGAWLLAAGVQEGDVVTRVNGRSILMPDAFMEIWESLPEADEISVRLLRNGEELDLSWPVVDE